MNFFFLVNKKQQEKNQGKLSPVLNSKHLICSLFFSNAEPVLDINRFQQRSFNIFILVRNIGAAEPWYLKWRSFLLFSSSSWFGNLLRECENLMWNLRAGCWYYEIEKIFAENDFHFKKKIRFGFRFSFFLFMILYMKKFTVCITKTNKKSINV